MPFEYKGESPLNLENIREEQLNDNVLQTRIWKFPELHIPKMLGKDIQVTCYVKPGNDPLRQWKVYLPDSMLENTVHWFHLALGHPGASRLKASISARYHNPRLHSVIQKYRCEDCRKYKADHRGWGLLPEREVQAEPFSDVAMDLIGP